MMNPIRLLLIDNYDSFTFNLYHLFAQLDGVSVTVKRNDEPFLSELAAANYDAVIIGPGPGSPSDSSYFGNCLQVIHDYGCKGVPILGVCLGFQGIAYAFGATLQQAPLPMHGKLSNLLVHQPNQLLAGLQEFQAMRYHSLQVDAESFPDDLVVVAEVEPDAASVEVNGREIMAIEHKKYPLYGVQFHPESFATHAGPHIAQNFIRICQSTKALPS